MKNSLIVARRELSMQLRSRGFIISVAASAIIIVMLILVPSLLYSEEEYHVGVIGDQQLTSSVDSIATSTGVNLTVGEESDEQTARPKVLEGDLDAVVVNDTAVIAKEELPPELAAILQKAHEQVTIEAQVEAYGLPAEEVYRALTVKPLSIDLVGDSGEDDEARTFLAFFILLALLFLLMSTTVSVATGVVEEKSSRIVEILLVALRSRDLLTGKLIAFGVLGLIQLAVFAIAGFATVFVCGLGDDLPEGTTWVVAATFTGYIFGFLFFGAMAAALASTTSRQEEVYGALGPMTAATLFTYLGAFLALNDPDSTLSRIVTILPPFSSMAMPVRMASGTVEFWEVVLSMILMCAAILCILIVGGKVYESSVLRTGSKIPLGEALGLRGKNQTADTAEDSTGGTESSVR